jgi:hypothetical protein
MMVSMDISKVFSVRAISLLVFIFVTLLVGTVFNVNLGLEPYKENISTDKSVNNTSTDKSVNNTSTDKSVNNTSTNPWYIPRTYNWKSWLLLPQSNSNNYKIPQPAYNSKIRTLTAKPISYSSTNYSNSEKKLYKK